MRLTDTKHITNLLDEIFEYPVHKQRYSSALKEALEFYLIELPTEWYWHENVQEDPDAFIQREYGVPSRGSWVIFPAHQFLSRASHIIKKDNIWYNYSNNNLLIIKFGFDYDRVQMLQRRLEEIELNMPNIFDRYSADEVAEMLRSSYRNIEKNGKTAQ